MQDIRSLPFFAIRTIALGVFLAGAGRAALAQGTWVPLTPTAPPGAPAELLFEPALSSASRSVFELRVHGFWRQTVVGADGLAYERLSFPGLGELGQPGAPELPAIRPRLAVATGAAQATLVSATVPPGELFHFAFPVYPMPIPGSDSDDMGVGNPAGTPETFVKDPAIYALGTIWPQDAASQSAAVTPSFARIPAAEVELVPARVVPSLARLQVARRTLYSYDHAGVPAAAPTMTKDLARASAAAFVNWPTASNWFQADLFQYHSRYLIVTPEAYVEALQPFITHRKSMGYSVTVRTLESLAFVTCGEIRGAIGAWYAAGPANHDHYCLLVGDADVLPMCPSATPELIPGDDRYGSPFGVGSLQEDVYVGRLAVASAGQLASQIAKIIAYELDADPAHDYRDVLLAAHKEEAPDKYVGSHEVVANAAYSVALAFQKFYGSQAASTDAAVLAAIQANLGLVAYRGHGTSTTWSGWNLPGENLTGAEVKALAQSQRPVVWSISCTNNAIDFGESIGEAWMNAPGGAVAHYGSTRESGTTKNHTLNEKMFEAVYRHGITVHGQAIAWAEAAMDAAHPDDTWKNSWSYLLLGCPAMKVRRDVPKSFPITAPAKVPVQPGGQPFTITVLDASGAPQPDVLVSIWKAPFDPALGPDELSASVYTGPGGQATFPGPTSLGTIIVTKRDDDGNVATEVIGAEAGAFTKLGNGTQGSSGVPRLESNSTLVTGTPASWRVKDARPATVGLMFVSLQDNPLPVFGGTVHVLPEIASFPVFTNANGAWELVIQPWPNLVPGLKLFFQAGLVDPEAQGGVALTNALAATVP